MKQRSLPRTVTAFVVGCMLAASFTGCGHIQRKRMLYQAPPAPLPLGSYVDQVNHIQERSGEASDFVVYQHEFDEDGIRLNMAGEDHVKQIAQRLSEGDDYPVIVERSMTSVREETEFKFPVHPNPELDLRRRKIIVGSLEAMGIADAEQRVVVAPALTPGYKEFEASRAYYRTFNGFGGSNSNGMGGGFGNAFGGFGGIGGIGGIF